MATPIPENRAAFTLSDLLTCTGGAVQGPLEQAAVHVEGISTDTRAVKPGQAFVALRGERFDGHEHLAAAHASGAVLAIVERDSVAPTGLTLLRVPSTLRALGQVAAFHADRWRCGDEGRQIVALTGSAGKTTTKVAIAALLASLAPGEVLATRGNLNNRIGLPMTLLCLEPAHRFAVLEMGTSQPGEIAALTRVAQPDVGLVTLVAAAHREGLGSVDDIAREKGALFARLRGDGVALGNADDPHVRAAMEASPAETKVCYGRAADATLRIEQSTLESLEHAVITLTRSGADTLRIRSALLGDAGAYAVAAAVATVEALLKTTLHQTQLGEVFAGLQTEGRMQARRLDGGLVIIDDSYNANPASCRASIAAARDLATHLGRPLVLVLGEMRELGDGSAEAHRALGEHAAASGARLLIAVSGDARHASERARDLGMCSELSSDAAAAADLARERVTSGDVVLVKGSRGVATEQVVVMLEREHCRTDSSGARNHPVNRRLAEGGP